MSESQVMIRVPVNEKQTKSNENGNVFMKIACRIHRIAYSILCCNWKIKYTKR